MLRGNSFRLVTLGRLTLTGDDGEEDASIAKRRRKLAVLAVLALARRPVTRDSLLEMFWGEQEEGRARHSLSNALSSLRGVLGQRSITTRESEVALDSEAPLEVDALEFADAMEAGNAARAVDMYGGPFLAGFHVEDSPAFEQWVFRERRRLEALFLKACAKQCETLARARRWAECHTLAGRWVDADPLSVDAALFLMNAVKAPGTRSALSDALDEYDQLRRRIEREYELAPDKRITELADRIRDDLATIERTSTAEIATAAITAEVAAPPPVRIETPPSVTAPPPQLPTPTPTQELAPVVRRFRLRRGTWIAAAVVLLTLGAVAHQSWWGSGGAIARANPAKPVVAVFTMDLRSNDSTLTWLTEGLPAMIDGKLARVEGVEVVAPAQVSALLARSGRTGRGSIDDATARDLAGRVGATIVARGAIGHDAGNLVLDLTVHDVTSGQLVHNAVLSGGDALALADEAAARIVNAANVSGAGPRLAELETKNVEAYQHYMRAVQAGQAGRRSEALREMDAALAIDSGFFTVLRNRMGAAQGANDTALVRRLRATMNRFSHRATEFDRLSQETYDVFAAGEHERSEALARGLVRRYPRDPRALGLLRDILRSHGKFEEAEPIGLQMLALDSLAMEAGTGPCAQCAGFDNMVTLHWTRNDLRSAAEWARRGIRQQPDAPQAWSDLGWTYAYMQLPDSAIPLLQRTVSLSGGDQWATEQYARLLLVARRYAAADSAIKWIEARVTPGESQAASDLRSLYEREHGRIRRSSQIIGGLKPGPVSIGFVKIIQSDNLRLLHNYAAAARQYDALVHPPTDPPVTLPFPPAGARALCWHHALAADAYAGTGDTITLRAIADTLQNGCSSSPYGRDWRLYHHVRGLIAMLGKRYEEAENEFKQAIWAPIEGWSRTVVELSKAQAAGGRPRDAIATLRNGYATRLDAMGRYTPISELDYWMARAFAQAGERDSARVYGDYVRSAWRDADPEIRQLLASLPQPGLSP